MTMRAAIIGEWFRIMRAELGFGMIKTMDELPKALRKKLDGETYAPPEPKLLWAPGGE